MRFFTVKLAVLASSLLAAFALPVHAQVLVTEVDPYSSGNPASSYVGDWFEVTNLGLTTISLSGLRMDDNSNSFASSVALRNVTSLLPGQSAIFLESASAANDATLDAAFVTAWFGGAAPAGFLIGNYGGSGVGLSQSGDAVNIFNAAGTLLANLSFGAATFGRTFDNAAGVNNGSISQLSAVGVNGAFVSSNGAEIGSPGVISAVPEAGGLSLMLAGIGITGLAVRRRRAR